MHKFNCLYTGGVILIFFYLLYLFYFIFKILFLNFTKLY